MWSGLWFILCFAVRGWAFTRLCWLTGMYGSRASPCSSSAFAGRMFSGNDVLFMGGSLLWFWWSGLLFVWLCSCGLQLFVIVPCCWFLRPVTVPVGHALSHFYFKGAICSLLLVGTVPWWLFYYAYVLWVTWGALVHAAYASPCPGSNRGKTAPGGGRGSRSPLCTVHCL